MKFERKIGEDLVEIETDAVQVTNRAEIIVYAKISELELSPSYSVPEGDNGMIAFLVERPYFDRTLTRIEIVDTLPDVLSHREFFDKCEEMAISVALSTGAKVILNADRTKYVIQAKVKS